MDKHGIVGASWLGLATWELAIGAAVIFIIWIISLFGLFCQWHGRFRKAATMYIIGLLVIWGLVATVTILGFISIWFYKKGIWPIGAIFRIVEIGTCISALIFLLTWIFGIVKAMFIPNENEAKCNETIKI
jgi:hypothetical protein